MRLTDRKAIALVVIVVAGAWGVTSSSSAAASKNRAGRLVITVTAHKYWRAKIDGREAPLLPANVAYQALDVLAGTHTIELRYRNPLILVGACISSRSAATPVAALRAVTASPHS